VLEVGKNEQRQDDASKKVTAPADIVVVRITPGFHPGPAVDPNAMGFAAKSRAFGLTADKKRAGEPPS
jgi:hypothetical protein